MNGDRATPNRTPVYTGTPPHTYFFAMPYGTTQDVVSCMDSTEYTVVPENFSSLVRLYSFLLMLCIPFLHLECLPLLSLFTYFLFPSSSSLPLRYCPLPLDISVPHPSLLPSLLSLSITLASSFPFPYWSPCFPSPWLIFRQSQYNTGCHSSISLPSSC